MNDNVELLRGVVIVLAVMGSYRIAQTCGGVSAGGKEVRRVSLRVGLWSFALTFVSSCVASLAEMMDFREIELFACIAVPTLGAYLLYRFADERRRFTDVVYLTGVFLSVMLFVGEEGGFFSYLLRSTVYGGCFLFALLLFSRIRYRTDESDACECFRGLPVYLLSGAFLSCALHGILKVWENLFT